MATNTLTVRIVIQDNDYKSRELRRMLDEVIDNADVLRVKNTNNGGEV